MTYPMEFEDENESGRETRTVSRNEKEKCIRAKLYSSTDTSRRTREQEMLYVSFVIVGLENNKNNYILIILIAIIINNS